MRDRFFLSTSHTEIRVKKARLIAAGPLVKKIFICVA
ncbi:hypothetical protein HNQ77_003258 [Silvibacterium bohemicum]|uniref:Uncharacterized protein n=1 Tax=Silvibacterium bohemicum TaxID=1577686 RepID=A0A841JVX6_9BACT|nr:hypothetical protein [Silvibacterium bohemicum]